MIKNNNNTTCEVRRVDHFNICSTLEIKTQNYFEHGEAEHSGIELCFSPTDTQHRFFRGKSFALRPKETMIFNAREQHTEECSKNPDINKSYSLIINSDFIKNLLKSTSISEDNLVFEKTIFKQNSNTQKLINDLFAARNTPHSSSVIFDCLVGELTLDLITNLQNTSSTQIKKNINTGHFPSSIEKSKQLIREELFSENLSLDKISKEAGLSKFHFIRYFKEATGKSPLKYINELRANYSKKALLTSKESILTMALNLGYRDISTFNKAFKRHTGLTPREYKKLAHI